ncbi:flavodoxin family protein [Hallella mizrahii]|uniref:Flavodoxin family protein n=1 Tax=Hallella mizrahii TaxID=2606637 RepID=A0A7K0KJ66_9BACT|nr:flavodoxin family protein [Hallella mizrahii]MST85977.1 flavodoxin family protein [Hallella mizrahii]
MKKTLIVYGSTTGNMESSVPHLSPTTLFVTHKVNM